MKIVKRKYRPIDNNNNNWTMDQTNVAQHIRVLTIVNILCTRIDRRTCVLMSFMLMNLLCRRGAPLYIYSHRLLTTQRNSKRRDQKHLDDMFSTDRITICFNRCSHVNRLQYNLWLNKTTVTASLSSCRYYQFEHNDNPTREFGKRCWKNCIYKINLSKI